MTESTQFINYNGYYLYYRSYGNGSKPMLAFHGFDRTGEDWQVYEKYLGNIFTIWAFDIFYHGESRIDETISDPYMGKSELTALMERFMILKNFPAVSLIGFSMGAKLVLSLVEMMPGKIENAIILAPDGIKISFWNSFVSRSFLGRIIFNQVVKNPKNVFRLSGLLKRLGIIHEKLDSFVRSQLSDKQQRKRILDIWILFRDMVPDKSRIMRNITRYKINFQMFFGKYDAVIPLKAGEKFAKNLKKPSLNILDCGHYMGGMVYEISLRIKQSMDS